LKSDRQKFGVDVEGAQIHIHTRIEHSRSNSNKIRQLRIKIWSIYLQQLQRLALKWQKSDYQDGRLEATMKIGQIEKIIKALGVLPKGILTPSFIEIAPAVTKRALLLTDDNDGQRRRTPRHCYSSPEAS
jgi:hypothetical protein